MAGSGQWSEGALDIPISAGMDLSSEPLAVPPTATLLSENTVFDVRGAARMRPGAVSGDPVPGDALGAFALGNTPVVLAPTARRYTEGEWANPNENPSDRHWSYDVEGFNTSSSGVPAISLSNTQETSAYRFVAWTTSTVLCLDVMLLDGTAVASTVIEGDVNVARMELFEQGASDTVRLIWTHTGAGEVYTCLVQVTSEGLVVSATQTLVATADNSSGLRPIAAVPKRTGYGFYIAYKAGGNAWPVVYDYNGSSNGLITLNSLYASSGNAQQTFGFLDLALSVVGGVEYLGLVYAAEVEHVVVLVFLLPSIATPWITNIHGDLERLDAFITADERGFMVVSTRANAQWASNWMLIDVNEPFAVGHDVDVYPETLVGYLPQGRPGTVRGVPVLPMVQGYPDPLTGGNPVTPFGRGGYLLSLSRNADDELAIASVGRYGIDAVGDDLAPVRAPKMRGRQGYPTTSDIVSGAYVSKTYGWDQVARAFTLYAVRERVIRHTQHTAEANGVVYVPGSQPLVFDGRNCVEATWLDAPAIIDVIEQDMVGASTGRSIVAVAYWLDAQGRMHRSMPSIPRSWSGYEAGDLDVYLPAFFFNFGDLTASSVPHAPWVEFYTKEIGVDPDHVGGGFKTASSVTFGVARYDVTSLENIVLYTDFGAELEAAPLPPTLAFELIGDRMWALEAEDRTRLWPSKTLAEGFAFEWAAELVREVPGEDILMLSQINGWPVAFRVDGLFVIYGDGPGNNGTGGEWSVPRKVSGAPGCYAGASVVKVPQGVLYQSDSGFHLLQPDLTVVDISPGYLGTQRIDVRAATYSDRDRRVVLWGAPGERALVWDARANAWSVWVPSLDTLTAVQLAAGGVFTLAAGDSDDVPLTYDTDDYADGDEAGLTVTWRSAWMQPAMLSGRCSWGPIFVTMRRLSAHSLTVRVYADGDETESSEHVFSPDDVAGETQGEVYLVQANNLFASPKYRKARTLSIELVADRDAELEGGAGAGMAGYPLACRVHVRSDQDTKRRQLSAGGRA